MWAPGDCTTRMVSAMGWKSARKCTVDFSARIDLLQKTIDDVVGSHSLGRSREIRDNAVAHHRFAIRDFGVPTAALMRATLDVIYGALDVIEPVYLHCWGGVGRTGTVVGCLLREQGLTGAEALDLIARKWRAMEKRTRHPRSPESPAQVALVEQWRGAR